MGAIAVLNVTPICCNKSLKAGDRKIGGDIVRHQQLVATWRTTQLIAKCEGDLFVDGDGTDFAAFALNCDGVFTQSLFGGSGVDAEALMDAQPGIAGQVHRKYVVTTISGHGFAQHAAEFRDAPRTVDAHKTPAFQCD